MQISPTNNKDVLDGHGGYYEMVWAQTEALGTYMDYNNNEKENIQLFSRTFIPYTKYEVVFGAPSPDGTKVIFNTENKDTFVAEAK